MPRNSVKAVIFDVDGTLLDSVDQHAQAWVDAFHDFGYDFSFGELRAQIGKGGDQLLPAFLSKGDIADKGSALEEHRGKLLKEKFLSSIVAFPDVRALVQRLLADGVAVALASSAKADELETYAKIAGIEDLIDTRVSSEDAKNSKPHPDIFDAALARLGGIDTDQIVVIGDSPYDAQAATKAGLNAIGVLSGGWTATELLEAGYVSVYTDPSDLLARYISWVMKP